MSMGWDGYCRLLVCWRQPLVGTPCHPAQTNIRYLENFKRVQGSSRLDPPSYGWAGIRSLSTAAAREYLVSTRTIISTAPRSKPETPLESASTDDAQSDPKPGATPELKDSQNFSQITKVAAPDLVSQLEKKRSKFAIQERSKENRLLVNQLLKDKSPLSYDWRIPVGLLEKHYKSANASSQSEDVRKFRKVAASDDAASETQRPRIIQRVLIRNLKEIRPVRGISKPAVWSKSSLAGYVKNLVEYEYWKDSRPQLRSRSRSNVADITAALNDVFNSSITKEFLSIQAYATALRFYYDNSNMLRARELFSQIEDSRLEITTDVFNLMLRGSASNRDLHSFTYILQKMIQRGLRPDFETWNALLMTISSSEVRSVIIQRMRERGILDNVSGKRGALRLIVQHEMGSHIEKRGDCGAFLDHMDDYYGKTWLTTSTGNKLLYEFGKRRLMSETLDLLPGMKLRGWKPDEISLDTLLRQCLLLRQSRFAIEVLDQFQYLFDIRPGKQAHETLFLLAQRHRSLNFARVVWSSACTGGFVTFKMRNSVFRSLLRNVTIQASDTRLERYSKIVGRFVVGVGQPQKKNLLRPDGMLEAKSFVGRQSIVQSAQMRLQEDLLVAGGPRFQEDLGKLLREALDLDLQWAKEKFLERAKWLQVLQGGIHIRWKNLVHIHLRHLQLRQHSAQSSGHIASSSVGVQARKVVSARRRYARTFPNLRMDHLKRAKDLRIYRRVVSLKPRFYFAKERRLLWRSPASGVIGKHAARKLFCWVFDSRVGMLSRKRLGKRRPAIETTGPSAPLGPLIRKYLSKRTEISICDSSEGTSDLNCFASTSRKDGTFRPRIRKQLSTTPRKVGTSGAPIRQRLYTRHKVATAWRLESLEPERKTASARLETARIHSILDNVLGLSEE